MWSIDEFTVILSEDLARCYRRSIGSVALFNTQEVAGYQLVPVLRATTRSIDRGELFIMAVESPRACVIFAE